MMKLWRLSLRFIKQNKKRALLSGIGISLSVILLSSVLFLSDTYSIYQKESEVYRNGTWLLKKPSNLEVEIDEALRLAPIKDQVTLSTLASSPLPNEQYIQIEAYSNFNEIYPFHLKDGNYPKNEEEIAVTQEYLNAHDLSIGSTITYEIGHRYFHNGESFVASDDSSTPAPHEQFHAIGKKRYTIVGTYIESTKPDGFTIKYKVITKSQKPSSPSTTYYTIDKISEQTWQKIVSRMDDSGMYCINQNAVSSYVEKEATLSFPFIITCLLLLGLLALNMIGLIKNIFAITLKERSSIFGTLECVGATPKQIYILLLLEAGSIAMLAIPIGFLISGGMLSLLYQALSEALMTQTAILVPFRLHIRPLYILIITLLVLCILILSTWLPIRRIYQFTPIEWIKKEAFKPYIPNKKYHLKKRQSIAKMIGLRYRSTNRKAHHAIIFSMSMSIILFLCSNYVISTWIASQNQISKEEDTIRIQLNSTGNPLQFQEMLHINDALCALNTEGQNHLETTMTTDIYIPDDYFSEQARHVLSISEQTDVTISIAISDQLHGKSKQHIQALTNGYITYQSQDNGMQKIPLFHFHEGDTLSLPYISDQQIIKQLDFYIKSTHYTPKGTQTPILYENEEYIPSITFYVSIDDYMHIQALLIQHGVMTQSMHTLYMKSDDPQNLIKAVDTYHNRHLGDILSINDPTKKTVDPLFTALRLLLNLFSCFILFIGIANILNTVISNIITRKKEIAVLESIGIENHQIISMLLSENLAYIHLSLLIAIPTALFINYTLYSLDFVGKTRVFDSMLHNILFVISISYGIGLLAVFLAYRMIHKESIVEKIRTIDF